MEHFLTVAFGLVVTIIFVIVTFTFISDAIHNRNEDDTESEV